jgi:hypothetical protein
MRVKHKIYTLEIAKIDTPLESCDLLVSTRVFRENLFDSSQSMKKVRVESKTPTAYFFISNSYTQPVGFGNPAYLHPCFAGPAGKSE